MSEIKSSNVAININGEDITSIDLGFSWNDYYNKNTSVFDGVDRSTGNIPIEVKYDKKSFKRFNRSLEKATRSIALFSENVRIYLKHRRKYIKSKLRRSIGLKRGLK